nr:hypothetical protein [Candidatus Sigynarchaeota archaeon]
MKPKRKASIPYWIVKMGKKGIMMHIPSTSVNTASNKGRNWG